MNTLYEITVSHNEHGTYLLVYSGRKSLRGLFDAMMNKGPALVNLTNLETFEKAGKAADGYVTDNGWKIKFSGRTKNAAETEGEHTFILDVVTNDR